jgi:flagellar biogenesis protein FliO
MAASEKKPPPQSAVPTWLIFCALGLAAVIGGFSLPGAFSHKAGKRESPQQPIAAIPAPQPPAQTGLGDDKKGPLAYEPPPLPEIAPLGPMLVRLASGTIFVLILCISILWAGKRWVRPLAAPVSASRTLRVLEALPLGGRCSVFLLQAGEANVLVGVDQAGIKALLPLPQPFDGALAEWKNPQEEEHHDRSDVGG